MDEFWTKCWQTLPKFPRYNLLWRLISNLYLNQPSYYISLSPPKKITMKKSPHKITGGGYLHTKNSPYVYLRVSFLVALAWVWNIFIVPSAHHGSGVIISLTWTMRKNSLKKLPYICIKSSFFSKKMLGFPCVRSFKSSLLKISMFYEKHTSFFSGKNLPPGSPPLIPPSWSWNLRCNRCSETRSMRPSPSTPEIDRWGKVHDTSAWTKNTISKIPVKNE